MTNKSATRRSSCLFLSVLLSFSCAAGEAALIKQLSEGSAAERDSARQKLLVSATPAAIPGLAAQLKNPGTFDNAVFLLEALCHPEADAALAAAIGSVDGRCKAGLLNALKRRDSPRALSAARGLCVDGPDLVKAAAWDYLVSVSDPSELARSLPGGDMPASARLTLADRLVKIDVKAAREQYAAAMDDSCPEHVRLAAFCGLLGLSQRDMDKLIADGLSRDSAVWRGTVASFTANLPAKSLRRINVKFMRSLPAAGRAALIEAFIAAGARSGAPFLRAALKNSDDFPAMIAAAGGLGDLGDASDSDTLIDLLSHQKEVLADAARMSLIKLKDPKTDARVVRALSKRKGEADAHVRLLGVTAFRKPAKAAPAALPYLDAAEPAVRAAALTALTEIADKKQLPQIFAAACKAADPQERRAAEKALAVLARKYPDAATAAARPLLATATAAGRRALLTALGIAGTPDGLALVIETLGDADSGVADDALRVLAGWHAVNAVPELLRQAESHRSHSLRVVALRGCLRLIAQEPELEARAAMCRKAAELAKRDEERFMLIGALSSVPTPESVAALKPYLGKPTFKNDAIKALRKISRSISVDVPDAAPGTLLSPVAFKARRVGDYRSEACAVADFNGDGKLDIIAGPFLYLAPDWKPVKIREIDNKVKEDGKGYADDFCNLVLDVNRDGRPDIIAAGWFDKTSAWYENPGGGKGDWRRHVIDPLGNHETGTLEDIDGDGKAEEFLPQTHVTVWYERTVNAEGRAKFTRHDVCDQKRPFGAGVGDINGDGRPDIIRPDAWFEAPRDIRKGAWRAHPIALGAPNGGADHTSNIIVCDVNADGLNDIITSVAHKHGIWWYEQRRDGEGKISWKQHLIDDTWSQPHYLAFADITGDGNKEIIVGKRFMAHNGNDPDAFGKRCVFFYRFTPGAEPVFAKHIVSYDEGFAAGLNIVPVDIDGDGDIDLVTTGKWGGPVVFENLLK
ncbi:MAG: FG-GAP-like repeat-containing protein [Kiritimatiellae bacterium]|nr:FG-GAP-like repeat-containing protein [Kiritimatiellia bacterium]MDD3544646.1 FG-GAP-like repeat-containing protein [Kiritimatiellia bacterium]MDD4025841.1 FG-GAP-like repeat-containing protein [Kiritimatiellia bacterium]